jgi:hypothetical protein
MTTETRPAEAGAEAVNYELEIEGTGGRTFVVPPPTGTPLEVALALLAHRVYELRDLPDSRPVRLLSCRREEYRPPRCRKPRVRFVRAVAATFTVGELRPQLIDKAKELWGQVPDGWL